MVMTKRKVLASCKGSWQFNTEAVQAIWDGRKTRAMLVMKPQPNIWNPSAYKMELTRHPFARSEISAAVGRAVDTGVDDGTLAWVAYDWCGNPVGLEPFEWLKPKFLPGDILSCQAASIFLKVTGVKVQGPRDLNREEILAEGVPDTPEMSLDFLKGAFAGVWDSTIEEKDFAHYNYDANPWCWVYEFEVMPYA